MDCELMISIVIYYFSGRLWNAKYKRKSFLYLLRFYRPVSTGHYQ